MSEFKDKNGQWECKKIDKNFLEWLNQWADIDKNIKYQKKEEQWAFKMGYQQAISDIYEKLSIKFKLFDKRTKTGFRKDE